MGAAPHQPLLRAGSETAAFLLNRFKVTLEINLTLEL